jgi:phospholipid/cholesterol/gamma-HCH transport system substrate-binding protein
LKLSREVKTGIFAVVSILLFIFGYNFLKGSNLFSDSRTFHVTYTNVEGLTSSAPVTINGLIVGKIQGIKFVDEKGDILVTFSVDSDFKFSKNSIARIYSSSLIGGKSIAIIPDYSSKNYAESNDYLKGEIELGMLESVTGGLKPLEEKVMKALSGMDTLLTNLNSILDDTAKENLKGAIANLNQTMYSFKGASANLNSILATNKDKLNATFSNLEVTSENFALFSDSLAKIKTGKMINELEGVLSGFNSIVTKIEAGEGSIGKLLKDDQLYNNLEGASKELELLLEDMKQNPKRYVHFSLFGKKPSKYQETPDTNN